MFDRLRRDWHLRDTDTRIARHGWTAVYVGDYAQSPAWTYTIGLEDTLQQPELVAFDVSRADANAVFWAVFEAMKSGALVLEDGKLWPDDDDHKVAFRNIHPSQIDSEDRWFAFALARRERRGVARPPQVFQIVVGDAERRFPWDPGYNEHLRFRQPALWLPAIDADVTNPDVRQALRLVGERGWTIVPVDGPEASWAYSVGLTEAFGVPEIMGFAPTRDAAARLLMDAREDLVARTLSLSDGARWRAIGPDAELCWRRVHDSHLLGFEWRYVAEERDRRLGRARTATETYQLFLPDAAGRYPWDPGCAAGVRDIQPLLFEPLDLQRLPRRMLAAAGRV